MAEPLFKLRRPAWLSGSLGVALIFALGFVCVVWAASGFTGWDSTAARALALPCAVGAGLAAGAIAGRMRRASFLTRTEAIGRGAIGFGAAGFAWPAASLFSADSSVRLLDALAPILTGAAIGAVSGALAVGAASVLFLTPAIERPSREPPPE